MAPKKIRILLQSGATFGRGDGVAGLVDREIEHSGEGFPFLRGKTLKGLLAESAENIVFELEELQHQAGWRQTKEKLFGMPGKGNAERGILHIGNAELPAGLQSQIRQSLGPNLTREDVLYSLTGIRRQTAVNPDGGPDDQTLRAMRVLLPGVILEADLGFDETPDEKILAFLAAVVLDFRRAGSGRNRGRGQLIAELEDENTTLALFNVFTEAVR